MAGSGSARMSAAAASGSVSRGLALLVAGSFFMEILDGTVIAPAAPHIAADLGVGAVDTYASWRWIFVVNVPLGVAALVLAGRLVPDVRAERPVGLDRWGFALTAVGVAALMVGVERSPPAASSASGRAPTSPSGWRSSCWRCCSRCRSSKACSWTAPRATP